MAGLTNRQMDTASYRDARSYLKTYPGRMDVLIDGWMDGWMDG
jgi:hypothetical protein